VTLLTIAFLTKFGIPMASVVRSDTHILTTAELNPAAVLCRWSRLVVAYGRHGQNVRRLVGLCQAQTPRTSATMVSQIEPTGE